MKTQYTHVDPGSEVRGRSGFYIPLKEVRLKHDGMEVIYMVGQATIEASCCARATFAFAVVPGYVLAWQGGRNQEGLAVSEVETIADPESQQEIARKIREAEALSSVEFW